MATAEDGGPGLGTGISGGAGDLRKGAGSTLSMYVPQPFPLLPSHLSQNPQSMQMVNQHIQGPTSLHTQVSASNLGTTSKKILKARITLPEINNDLRVMYNQARLGGKRLS